MQELIDAIEAAFTEAEVFTSIADEDSFLDGVRSTGMSEFKVRALPAMMRHPSTHGRVYIPDGSWQNYAWLTPDGKYDVITIRAELTA